MLVLVLLDEQDLLVVVSIPCSESRYFANAVMHPVVSLNSEIVLMRQCRQMRFSSRVRARCEVNMCTNMAKRLHQNR